MKLKFDGDLYDVPHPAPVDHPDLMAILCNSCPMDVLVGILTPHTLRFEPLADPVILCAHRRHAEHQQALCQIGLRSDGRREAQLQRSGQGNGGGYVRMDVGIPQPIPDPRARPEAG
jgi:hypothetical protein